MPFEMLIALRFLREGRMQSVLIVGGVTVGVGVIIFISALISGLQGSLIQRTLGSQAHVVVQQPEDEGRPLYDRTQAFVAGDIEKPPQRLRLIKQWQNVVKLIDATPGVVATAPMLSGSAFAVRGNDNRSIAILGVDPVRYARVINIADQIKTGTYRLTGTDAIIGVELARELDVTAGDKIRLVTAEGQSGVFTLSGIFDLGNRDVNRRWVLLPLRAAQSLLNAAGGITHIEVHTRHIFDDDSIAASIQRRTGLHAESWMTINSQLMIGLRSQSSSSYMIQFFVIIAIALGIASVLVVSVVQKSKEIGILRAMGVSPSRIQTVFLLQGVMVGAAGSILGSGLGTILAILFQNMAVSPDGAPLFPVDLNLTLYVMASGIAVVTGTLAALAPARRAAKLDPAEAIHG